jgi:mono/diheme cytochrome c family protein
MRTWVKVAALVAACGLVVCAKKTPLRSRALALFRSHPAGLTEGRVEPLGEAHAGSTVVLARVGGHELAYVADEDDAVVHIVDTMGLVEVGTARLAARPGQLLVLPDGRLLAAIRGGSEVAVLRIHASNIGKLDALPSIPTPLEPIGLATTPDDKELLVASGWGHSLTGFDLATGRRVLDRELSRDPRAVITSKDGSKAFVSHAVGSTLSVVDLADPGHTVIDSSIDGWSTEEQRVFLGLSSTGGEPEVRSFVGMRRMVTKRAGFFDDGSGGDGTQTEQVVHPRKACQGFALARIDGPEERVLAPLVEVEPGDVTARSFGYGGGQGMATEMPDVAVVPVATAVALPASMEVFQTTRAFGKEFEVGIPVVNNRRRQRQASSTPCVLPRAAAAGQGELYVACLGIDTVVEYDAEVDAPERVQQRRWQVPSGPTGLALLGSRLFVWSQFARTLTVVDLSHDDAPPPASADALSQAAKNLEDAEPESDGDPVSPVELVLSRLPAEASSGDVALGRELFHATSDNRISQDGRGCASCHPDGRDDSLTWSTPGGPRQTPMLAGRLADTSPYGWDGAGKDVTMHLTHTFQRLQGRGLEPHEVASLVAYIKSLPVPPRAGHHDAAYGEQVARGKEIFHSSEAGCSTCHAGDGVLTDGVSHDVESKLDVDQRADFDTPSLRFVGGTAPYFHDGRYASLRDVLTHTDGTMAKTAQLSPEELDALEAYVRTL